jgi:GAF domain-containing protein
MIVPILVRQELVGVLNVASREPKHMYTEDDLNAFEVFAQNAGTCIRHAEQSTWMRQIIENKAEAQSRLAEAPSCDPDPGTSPYGARRGASSDEVG